MLYTVGATAPWLTHLMKSFLETTWPWFTLFIYFILICKFHTKWCKLRKVVKYQNIIYKKPAHVLQDHLGSNNANWQAQIIVSGMHCPGCRRWLVFHTAIKVKPECQQAVQLYRSGSNWWMWLVVVDCSSKWVSFINRLNLCCSCDNTKVFHNSSPIASLCYYSL